MRCASSRDRTMPFQVGTALARDTAGQAQAALQQIERLRDEAQAHTQRAVSELKGSFETVITQIGRQLEQMRGQFDNTSRGMRETAQKTASDLDSLRQEMQKRMEGLPEHTAQATAAIRKALSEQLREIEAITTPVLARPAAPPQAPAPAPEPFRQAAAQPRPQPFQPAPQPAFQPAPSQFDLGPLPRFDARGRPVGSPDGDIGQVAGGLASQLSNAAYVPQQGYAGASLGAPAAPPAQGGGQLRLDEIARAIDYRTAADVWQRFRAGERGVLGRHIYTIEGQATFDEIARRYEREPEFRMTVDRYIGDFERLLGDAEASDPDGRMLQNYLTSEVGTRLSAARACERTAALDDFPELKAPPKPRPPPSPKRRRGPLQFRAGIRTRRHARGSEASRSLGRPRSRMPGSSRAVDYPGCV